MNVEVFFSILAALVVARFAEPGVDALRAMLWGGSHAARNNACGSARGSGSVRSR